MPRTLNVGPAKGSIAPPSELSVGMCRMDCASPILGRLYGLNHMETVVPVPVGSTREVEEGLKVLLRYSDSERLSSTYPSDGPSHCVVSELSTPDLSIL